MNLKIQSLAPELKLILALISPGQPPYRPVNSNQLMTENTDWRLVIEYAKHHRIIPTLYNNLKKICPELVPENILETLKNLNASAAKQSLAQAAELKRIIPALNRKNIKVSILKGRALAKLLYGNISQRQSRDIDLLVEEKNVIKTDKILHELGYTLSNLKSGLPLNSDLGRQFIKGRPELDYISKSRGTCIDLHWHLSHCYHAFPVDMNNLWSEMKLVDSEFGLVNELPISIHFIFLCYHGAKHHWLRLHWLLDIAILVNQGNLDWDTIIVSAKKFGVLPTISLATILANKFFKSPIPQVIQENTELLKIGNNLAEKMIQDIISSPGEIEQQVMPFMDFKRIKFGHLLQTKINHKFLTWTDLLYPSETDYQSVKLPARLYFLYYMIRPLILAGKLLQRIFIALVARKPGHSESLNRL